MWSTLVPARAVDGQVVETVDVGVFCVRGVWRGRWALLLLLVL
jgi:hypothetical protein